MSGHLPSALIPENQSIAPPAPIFLTWLKAFTSPSERTYTGIAGSPNAKTGKAVLWVFLSSLLEMIVYFLVVSPLQRDVQQSLQASHTVLPAGVINPVEVLCGAPLAALVMVLWFLITAGITHMVARAFSGMAAYGQWTYVLSTIFVPTALISTVLLGLDGLGRTVALCAGAFSLVLALYVTVLEIIAVKAVQQISWGGAVVSIVAIPAILVCLSLAAIVVLMLSGPAIGNIFSGINQSLQGVP